MLKWKIKWSNHIKQENIRKKTKSSLNILNDGAMCKVQKLKIKCQYKAQDVLWRIEILVRLI